jgi:hypothetical protein
MQDNADLLRNPADMPAQGRGVKPSLAGKDGAVFVPDRVAAARYNKTPRTLDRWDRNPAMGFPKPIIFGGFKYRVLAQLEAWEQDMIAKSATARTVGHRARRNPETSGNRRKAKAGD